MSLATPDLSPSEQKFLEALNAPIETGAQKFDKEKIQVELVSPTWVLGVAAVLTFGAKKYSAENWRNGIALKRLIGAAERHLLDFKRKIDLDEESGLNHLYHASCCLMFASEIHRTKPELDDRVKE
jgi:hypothetical protein